MIMLMNLLKDAGCRLTIKHRVRLVMVDSSAS
jgi:hypothetical protein